MSNGTSRINFPGLKSWVEEDTATHQVEVVRIEDGGAVFTLTFIRNKILADKDVPFVIAKIGDDKNQPLWNFKSEGFDGVGLLAKAGEVVVVALCGRGKEGKVERAIPLSQVTGGKPLDLRATIALKKAAATFLDKKFVLSGTEKKLVEIDAVRAHEAEEARRAAEAEVRAAERAERINAIHARGTITVFTADGRKLFGTPVTEKEWMSLNNGAYAVIVESIDADGKPVGPREWFQVVKLKGRNPKKDSVKPVTIGSSQAKAAVAVRPIRTSFVETKDGAFEVLLFESMEQIREAWKGGLNSGAYVALNGEVGSEVEVYTLHQDKAKTVGKCALIV